MTKVALGETPTDCLADTHCEGEIPMHSPSMEGLRGGSHNLDLLRSFAVLLVVGSHLSRKIAFSPGREFIVGPLGLLGVAIFFVHTSLVLMLSLKRQPVSIGNNNLMMIFYIRRIFRIYPLSIFIVIVTFLSIRLSGGIVATKLVLSNLFLIQNITKTDSIPPPLWSLPFEVQMYIVLPMIFFLIRRHRGQAERGLWMAWLGSVLMVLAAWKLGLNYHLIKYFPCFLPGIMAAVYPGRRGNWHPVFLAIYLLLVAVLLPWAVALGAKEHTVVWPICLGLGLLIPKCRETTGPNLAIFGKTIATYSYGIYLVHTLCLAFGFDFVSTNHIAIKLSAFVGSLGLSTYLLYHLIEKPLIKLGVCLTDKLMAKMTVEPQTQIS